MDNQTAETICVTKSQYESLLEDSKFLEALRQAGVDNWDGYSYAFEIMDGWDKE